MAYAQGDYPARALVEESFTLSREMGDKDGIAFLLANMGYVTLAQGNTTAARRLFEESLALCKEMDDKTDMAYALLGLGLVDLVEGTPEAHEHILHSLRLRQEMGKPLQQTSSLIGAAELALHEGDASRAAQLLGTVESALKTLNAAMEPEYVRFHAQTLAAVKAQLGGGVPVRVESGAKDDAR